VVVGMAMGVGGLTQLLAGMWEFAEGNSLGATGGFISLKASYLF
jgi:succinate-acetate transporter protein